MGQVEDKDPIFDGNGKFFKRSKEIIIELLSRTKTFYTIIIFLSCLSVFPDRKTFRAGHGLCNPETD